MSIARSTVISARQDTFASVLGDAFRGVLDAPSKLYFSPAWCHTFDGAHFGAMLLPWPRPRHCLPPLRR